MKLVDKNSAPLHDNDGLKITADNIKLINKDDPENKLSEPKTNQPTKE
jgi:hypothetical protein